MRIIAALFTVLLTACAQGKTEEPTETAELTRRQKDSLIAEMPIPHAGAVGKALDALEASERRAEAHDTIH